MDGTAYPSEMTDGAPAPQAKSTDHANHRVLVIEDDPRTAQLFSAILEHCGHDVLLAESGRHGLELARAARPDLVLLDIQLPELSGLEVIKILKGHPSLKSTPVIAVTAFAMNEERRRIMSAGFDAYLSKPISVGPFMETIQSMLNEGATRPL